jgi:hypothetical protein
MDLNEKLAARRRELAVEAEKVAQIEAARQEQEAIEAENVKKAEKIAVDADSERDQQLRSNLAAPLETATSNPTHNLNERLQTLGGQKTAAVKCYINNLNEKQRGWLMLAVTLIGVLFLLPLAIWPSEVLFAVFMLLLFSGLVFLYFLPTYIACTRSHKNEDAIFALNFLAGWTFVGWVISIVWALTKSNKSA